MKKKTTYLVMETRPAYVVLMDNRGRFIKAANMGYNRGEIVEDIIPIRDPKDVRRKRRRMIEMAVGLAACVCLAVFGVRQYEYVYMPYGSIRMEINPGVVMEVSRSGMVLDLEGTNADGRGLIDGYEYKGKDRYEVVDDLADKAIEMEFLSEGGDITITADGKSDVWMRSSEQDLRTELEEHLARYNVRIVISTEPEEDVMIQEEKESITIPAPVPETPQTSQPVQEPPASGQQEASAGDSGYGEEEDDGAAASGDSGYGEDGDSGYETDD